MIKEVRQKIDLSPELKKKITWATNYTNVKGTLENGALIRLEPTNIAYVEPHRLVINATLFLFFNGTDTFFMNDFNQKYKLSELDKYLKLAI